MNRSRFARLAAAAISLGIVAVACSSDEGAVGVVAAPPAPSAETSATLQVSAPGADGTTIDLADYAGQDLMLWFWAPW